MSDGGSLRDQQAEFTKQLLFEAVRTVIDDNPLEEFTMQQVAEEAGVSHRTVYRYFPSRHELLNEFTDWIESTVATGKPSFPETIEDVGPVVRQAFARFDQHAPYFRASVILATRGQPLRPKGQIERDEAMRATFDRLLGDLEEDQIRLAYAVIRHLVGAQTWQIMRDRFELKEGEAGEAVGWAVQVLTDALAAGNAPSGLPTATTINSTGSDEEGGAA